MITGTSSIDGPPLTLNTSCKYAKLDDALIRKINKLRIDFDRNPGWSDQRLPVPAFDRSRPATFVQVHLLRAA
jgi:hypothetical protein